MVEAEFVLKPCGAAPCAVRLYLCASAATVARPPLLANALDSVGGTL